MANSNKGSHLTLEERKIIQTAIENGSTKAAIALTLGKDKSTIGKEIKLHRFLKFKSSFSIQCAIYKSCKHGRHCSLDCPDFVKHYCARRDRSPGACNKCPSYQHCRFDKFFYDAAIADREYHESLVDSRQGVNLTTDEVIEIAKIIKPLLAQGQSPYAIIHNHPELHMCEKTLYSYIQDGVFAIAGIHDVDLRRKVSRKIPKKRKNMYKKREDRKFLNGRLYDDYINYIKIYPHSSVVEMDTVYNDVSNGPFIQTFKFLDYGFIFAIFHQSKTSDDMNHGVDLLDNLLGHSLFNVVCEVLLTDRGTEFSDPLYMESRPDDSRRSRIFYCDPMQSGQKGSLENKHIEVRYILPKATDLWALGLQSQADLNLALSHINSYPLKSLKGKTPIQMMKFLNPDLWNKFKAFGISEIAKDDVNLTPYLLKKRH